MPKLCWNFSKTRRQTACPQNYFFAFTFLRQQSRQDAAFKCHGSSSSSNCLLKISRVFCPSFFLLALFDEKKEYRKPCAFLNNCLPSVLHCPIYSHISDRMNPDLSTCLPFHWDWLSLEVGYESFSGTRENGFEYERRQSRWFGFMDYSTSA